MQNPACGFGHEIVEPFLRTFEGLEELFVSYWNSTKGDYVGRWNSVTSELWDRAVHHRATLRRLAYHMRETEWRGPENDVLDEGLYSWAAGQTEEGPSQHPFASLDLDFIGLSCVPELLEPILLPFASKASLKVLHVRQASTKYKWSVALRDINDAASDVPSSSTSSGGHQNPASQPDGVDPERDADTADASQADSYDAFLRARLRPKFTKFAEWAFGPQGIGSLRVIAFGDFGRGGRPGRTDSEQIDQLILSRNTHAAGEGKHGNFRILSHDDAEARVFLDEYRDALEALPMEPLLRR